jgi:hypothetical protein
LRGRDRYEGFPAELNWITHTHDAARRLIRKLTLNDPQKRTLYWNMDGGNFTKLLAKIAYGFAIILMDGRLTPLVLGLIPRSS